MGKPQPVRDWETKTIILSPKYAGDHQAGLTCLLLVQGYIPIYHIFLRRRLGANRTDAHVFLWSIIALCLSLVARLALPQWTTILLYALPGPGWLHFTRLWELGADPRSHDPVAFAETPYGFFTVVLPYLIFLVFFCVAFARRAQEASKESDEDRMGRSALRYFYPSATEHRLQTVDEPLHAMALAWLVSGLSPALGTTMFFTALFAAGFDRHQWHEFAAKYESLLEVQFAKDAYERDLRNAEAEVARLKAQGMTRYRPPDPASFERVVVQPVAAAAPYDGEITDNEAVGARKSAPAPSPVPAARRSRRKWVFGVLGLLVALPVCHRIALQADTYGASFVVNRTTKGYVQQNGYTKFLKMGFAEEDGWRCTWTHTLRTAVTVERAGEPVRLLVCGSYLSALPPLMGYRIAYDYIIPLE